MSSPFIILLIAALALFLVCVVLAAKIRAVHKAVQKLSDEIEEHLRSEKKISFDTRDSAFSRLHNDVSDLCDKLALQKQNRKKDNIPIKNNLHFGVILFVSDS